MDDQLRRMAKNSYYQNLYDMFKSGSHIQMFDNTCNFSSVQVRFLYWLSIYHLLYEDLMKHEDDLLTQAVIDDNDRVDAYLIYRNKKHDYLWKKYRTEEKISEHKAKHPNKHKDGKTNLIDVDLRREG